MIKHWKSRLEIGAIPWFLPVLLLLPYAVFVDNFRLLRWVRENAYWPFWSLLGFSVLAAALSSYLLLRANNWGRKIFLSASFFLLSHCVFLAMRERRHFILVLLFFLCVAVVFLAERVRQKLSKPYFSPRRIWNESLPASTPGVRAFLRLGGDHEGEKEVRPSNLGEDGCFVFMRDGFFTQAPAHIRLKSGEKLIMECDVELVYLTKDKTGAGLVYLDSVENAGDWNKEYFDYLHFLRRAGYEN